MRFIGAMVLGFFAAIGMDSARHAEAASPVDTLTEWTIPFPNSLPLWIALRGQEVVFRDFNNGQVGRLDPQGGSVTVWPLPYISLYPGDLKVRSSDGAVFLTAGNEGEIGQFDIDSGVLRRWPLPIGVGAGPIGPMGLAIDEDGGVLFSAWKPSNDGSVIGRLDTTTGDVDVWPIPASMVLFIAPIAAGPNHTVFFADNGFGPRNVVRLDTTTGAFTSWPVTHQLPYDVAADATGQIYFQEVDSVSAVARLIPETGRVTEWRTPGGMNDRLGVLGNRVIFGSADPAGLAVLDTTHPGRESIAPPFAPQTVAPTSSAITPIDQPLVAQTAQSTVQSRTVRRRSNGAFDGWATGVSARSIAATDSPRAIYFGEDGQPVIGRINN
jgi:streptogramin lyase